MAIGATMYTFDVQLADVDRGVYEDFALRVAKHPSETDAFMVTRIIAYCLEYGEGIAFGSGGVSSTDEPAVLVRDLTGAIVTWIEVGVPSPERLHSASKAAENVAVYTHRDPEKLLASLAGKKIHQAETIRMYSLEPGFIDAVAANLSRRNTVSVSRTEGQLYLELHGESLHTEIGEHAIG
ncbi:YaeQ family protein [Leucobacter chinensis]|uniref:YaeQ family protein n=1 Tax=Leucobacter chinensis TaxID=2851010 RepID=UPI001C2425E5|nr:YaeQ family protein [Leucobacter chinensis]